MGFLTRFFGTSAPASNAMKDLIMKHTSTNEVIIYSKSYCPFCMKTKSLFQTEFPHIKAAVFELDQMQEGNDIQSALAEITGQRTVPNVWVKGQFIGGNDDTHSVFRSGKLKEMLSS